MNDRPTPDELVQEIQLDNAAQEEEDLVLSDNIILGEE